MSIKVKVDGKKVIIETDYEGSAHDQGYVMENGASLFRYMKHYGIKEVETGGGDFCLSNLKDEVEKILDKKGIQKRMPGFRLW